MNWLQALILGIVEGVTEYLPISSTGHLLLTQRLFGIGANNASEAFAICIQAGAIGAVLTLYFGRVRQILEGLIGRNPDGKQMAQNLFIAFLPAIAVGLVLEKPIKAYLFGGELFGLWPVVGAWFVGGLIILGVAAMRRRRRFVGKASYSLVELTWQSALVIGTAQCLAMWPGTSRSLVTIAAGIVVGLRMIDAVEFSFLLGVLTLSAATAHDLLKHGHEMLVHYGPMPLAVGFVAAWLSAMIAVKWMVGYLHKHGLSIFGYYRIALAMIVALLLLNGYL